MCRYFEKRLVEPQLLSNGTSLATSLVQLDMNFVRNFNFCKFDLAAQDNSFTKVNSYFLLQLIFQSEWIF